MTAPVSEPAVFNWRDLPAEEVYPGIRRRTISASQQTVVSYRYEPGCVFPLHAHPQEQVTFVLSGSIIFTVDGAELQLGPGDVAVIPGGIEHGARVEGDESVETINTLSPRRDHAPGGQESSSSD